MNCHENSHDESVVIASLAYQILYRYLKPFMIYPGFERPGPKIGHIHTHTHTRVRVRVLSEEAKFLK